MPGRLPYSFDEGGRKLRYGLGAAMGRLKVRRMVWDKQDFDKQI